MCACRGRERRGKTAQDVPLRDQRHPQGAPAVPSSHHTHSIPAGIPSSQRTQPPCHLCQPVPFHRICPQDTHPTSPRPNTHTHHPVSAIPPVPLHAFAAVPYLSTHALVRFGAHMGDDPTRRSKSTPKPPSGALPPDPTSPHISTPTPKTLHLQPFDPALRL
eukprot:3213907-Rhodomonas_salina.1